MTAHSPSPDSQQPRSRRHLLLIINPTAGHYSSRRQDQFVHALQQAGFKVTVRLTRYRGHGAEITQMALPATASATDAARTGSMGSMAGPGALTAGSPAEERQADTPTPHEETHWPDIIMAGGGDGTIAEIAQAMMKGSIPGRTCTLALWPVGSANVLARELGIPFDDATNAALLASGWRHPLWPGWVTTAGPDGKGQAEPQLFLQMVGGGLDGWVVQHLSTTLKKRIGRLAYLITALRLPFTCQLRFFTTIINGRDYKGHLTIISKGRFYGGPYPLLPESRYTAPDFTIFILHRLNPLAVIWQGLARLMGWPAPRHPAFTFTHGDDVRCTALQPVPAQSDGDYRGMTPLHVKASATPLHVIAPAEGRR